jgi:membrane protein implicated in regulation of membrane protease activity
MKYVTMTLLNDPAFLWWMLSAGLVLVELMTGTFYLLMLALGAAAAALSQYLGAPVLWQVMVAALLGVVGGAVLNLRQKASNASLDSDLHLDIGKTVMVQEWDAQGQTQVKHRGAVWTALTLPHATAQAGMHRIVEISGSRLVLEKIQSL